ncbi:hypothetical protein YQE_08258, partial [Dendroctonus ponderosae]
MSPKLPISDVWIARRLQRNNSRELLPNFGVKIHADLV